MSTIAHHILRCLTLPLLLSLAPGALAEKTFRWVDEDGQVNYGDRVPPRYSKQERHQINEQGRTIKVYEAPKTPEQKAEEKRQAIIEAARKKIAEKRLRYDRTLLATYSNEDDMIMARDGKIAAVESLIQLTHRRIKSMQNRLLQLTDEAAEYERSGKKLPLGLQQQLLNVREQITQNENFVKDKTREIEEIRVQFETDIERFNELTSDDPEIATASLPDIEEIEREIAAQEAKLKPEPVVSRKPRKQRADLKLTRRDRTLLNTFSSESDLLDARADKLAMVDVGIRRTGDAIDELQGKLAAMVDNADEYQSRDEKPPNLLLREMQQVLDEIAKNEGIMEAHRREKREIERQFEMDLARYRAITVEN